ncbi:MAG: hypothetical protein AB8I08_10450 [Sandaracinaceae bacterium]
MALLVVLGVTAFLHAPVVDDLAGGETAWFEWDVPEQYWPDLVLLCGDLHAGELPSWSPWDRGGYPRYADPQAGTYHPLNWLVCGAAGASPSMGWATFRVVFHFFLAGAFGLLWLRRLGASWAGAIAGATLIEAAPFMRHAWELNLSSAMAYLPLMLFAAEGILRERRARDGALLALATGLCGWVGSPPALWFAASFTGLYLAFRLGQGAREASARGYALPLTMAATLTAGLLLVMLVPGAQLAAHSVQAGRSLASIRQGALDAEQLVAMVWPQPGNHLYVGWLALVLMPVAMSRRREAWLLFLLAALGLVLATGGALFEWAFEWVPGVRHFRAPIRYESWIGPAMAGGLALGLTHLRGKRTAWGTPAGALLLTLGAALLIALEGRGPGLLALALGGLSLLREHRPDGLAHPLTGAALALLLLLDVTQTLPPHRHMRRGEPTCGDGSTILSHAPGEGRVMDEFAIGCRAGTRIRRPDLRGYQDPLILRTHERVVGSLRDAPGLAPQFGVRYALSGPHFIHGWDRHYLPPPGELRARLRTETRFEDAQERSVTEFLDALPGAYFVPADEIEVVPDRSDALARVRELAPSAIAVLDREAGAVPLSSGPRGAAAGRRAIRWASLTRRNDSAALSIDVPEAGVVVINEAHYPGWRAWVDDEQTAVLRANGFVRAVPIEAGSHRVELRFEPADGPPWRWLYLLSLVAAAAVIVWRPRQPGGGVEKTT